MHWIVQENVRDEATYDAFIAALRDQNVEHSVVKIIPFSHETIPDVNPTGRVVVWGSTTLDLVAKNKGWKPGTFLNENHDQRVWTEAYGRENMLNGDAEYYEFCKVPAFDGVRFIRPVEDMKVFAGTLIHGTELAHWQVQTLALADSFSTLTPKTVVSVSMPKDILTEWRFFVVAGKVVTGAMYRWGGKLYQHGRADLEDVTWGFAQTMVDKWAAAEAFVIDIATIRAPECTDWDQCPTFYDGCNCFFSKVIEVNCINSCGFYDADMGAVVKAIEAL